MNEMERGRLSEDALEARKRGMSYGQYVAARYYPVEIVEALPNGGMNVRRLALPPIIPGWEEIAERHRSRSVDGPCRSTKKPEKQRLCVVCGGVLGRYERKYCGAVCSAKAAAARTRPPTACLPALREDKPCAVCGKPMHQVLRNQAYCGPECRRIGTARRQRAWQAEHPPEPKPPRYCRICGIRIEGNGWKYCPNCAGAAHAEHHKAYRQRKAGAQNEEDAWTF